MVRSLANIFYKGIAAFPAARSNASRSFYQGLNRFSTTVPNDPDTHEDLKPTSKVESSGLSLKDIVEQDIKENPVMIYMKGVPELPRCGFNALAVRVLKEYDVPLSARNILEDPELKNVVKAVSQWPTFPQIFIKGEFVGGSDIILDMHKKGDLERNFEKIEEDLERNFEKIEKYLERNFEKIEEYLEGKFEKIEEYLERNFEKIEEYLDRKFEKFEEQSEKE